MSETGREAPEAPEAPEEHEVEKALGTGAREAVGGDLTRSYVPEDEAISPNATVVTGAVVAGDPETHDDKVEAPAEAPAEDSVPAPTPAGADAPADH